MLEWFLSVLRREISRRAVEGIPSSSVSNLMCLIAITLFWAVTALYTRPNAPSPIKHSYL